MITAPTRREMRRAYRLNGDPVPPNLDPLGPSRGVLTGVSVMLAVWAIVMLVVS